MLSHLSETGLSEPVSSNTRNIILIVNSSICLNKTVKY